MLDEDDEPLEEERAEFYLKEKQQQAVDAANDPDVDTLILFGTVGTGKTDVAAHIVISICDTFPKTRWPVFRQNLSTSQDSIIPSYLDMLERMGFVRDVDYIYREKPYRITFPNKSTIPFREADITKDREAKKLKGINASGNHIDEGDELAEVMLVTATSRKGRHNEYGQPSLSIHTLNPTDHPYYMDIYNKYKEPEKYGELPKNIRCIEFGLEDSWQSQQDIDAMLSNPDWWVQRYIKNNWNYKDEDKTIFKSHVFAKARTETIKAGKKGAGYDVAEDGVDRSVYAEWEGLTLIDIIITKDTKEKVATDKQAQWLKEHSDQHSIGYENIAVDGVGIGVGVLSAGRLLNAVFDVYKSGYAVDPYLTYKDHAPTKEEVEKMQDILSFDMLRSQVAYLFAMGMEQGFIKILASCPYYNDLKSEAQSHYHKTTDKVFRLESKDSIKKRTGKSPDIFDAVIMGLWKQLKKGHVIEWASAADMA